MRHLKCQNIREPNSIKFVCVLVELYAKQTIIHHVLSDFTQ